MVDNEPSVSTSANHSFSGVTLLITHYNRSRSLQRLLAAFTELGCHFEDIVVSDDGSRAEHYPLLVALQRQHGFRLITTPQNRGLGHNLNKGQNAVQTDYVLYVQEDFIPKSAFVQRFRESLVYMKENKALDIIRYYAYIPYPNQKPYAGGFTMMQFSPWTVNYNKVYCYSDHPHLRRQTFFSKFGHYAEGLSGDKTEYRMCISFLQQKGVGLFYSDYKGLFEQKNDTNEPSTMQRVSWTQSRHLFIAIIRYIYRQIKYNYDVQYMSLPKSV